MAVMRLRRQLPVYSPLVLGAVAAGCRAALPGAGRPALMRLEQALRERWSADVATLTDSGTTALALAIRLALRGRPGAAVALPAYCCYDVASAALAAPAPVVLYDVDPTTLGPDWDSLATVTGADVGAVVVAHLFGLAVDMDRAAAVCASAGVALIEDAAQGIGGSWRDRPLGALAPLSVLSFGRGKGLTGGAGGALLGRNVGASLGVAAGTERGAAPCGARTLAAVAAQWVLGRPNVYGLPASLPFLRLGETVFRPPRPPRGLAGAPAAVVLAGLQHAAGEADTRRGNASRLAQRAVAAGLGIVPPLPHSQPGYLRLPSLGGPDPSRPAAAELGIAAGYPRSLADLPELATACRNVGSGFPGARRLAAHLWTAPTHSRLTEQDLRDIERWMGTS